MLRKILLTSIILTCSIGALSQEATSSEKLYPQIYDPTQLYTRLSIQTRVGDETYATLEPGVSRVDFWYGGEFFAGLKFESSVNISDKFQVYAVVPITSKEDKIPSNLFDNTTLGVKYQIHNNSGRFKASLVDLQITSPIVDDPSLNTSSLVDASPLSFSLQSTYTASIQITDWLGVYPRVGYKYKRVSRNTYIHIGDSLFVPSSVSRHIFIGGVQGSFIFTKKLFAQLSVMTEFGSFQFDGGTLSEQYNESTTTDLLLSSNFTLNFASSPSHLFQIGIDYHRFSSRITPLDPGRRAINRERIAFLGYTFFI